MLTLGTNQFQTTFARAEEGKNPIVIIEVTVNSKEENSEDFCPNYVQGFSLWVQSQHPQHSGIRKGSI